jgi:hypothetical protein
MNWRRRSYISPIGGEDGTRHIAEELLSPETAMRQYNRIADSILSLETMPERIKIMDTEPENSFGFRRLLVGHYSVFFVIKDDDGEAGDSRKFSLKI